MNWVQRKIYLYNVTFGLYMLDWWERLLFNAVLLVLMWFVCLNGAHHISEIYRSYRNALPVAGASNLITI
ncbi:uncharacterized protein [Primulina huaijiensis]|uniref:uncharacterized protein n=1 Tax=Primulina huaijiensis TaxID=1492673 RepID=UPI003CC709E5